MLSGSDNYQSLTVIISCSLPSQIAIVEAGEVCPSVNLSFHLVAKLKSNERQEQDCNCGQCYIIHIIFFGKESWVFLCFITVPGLTLLPRQFSTLNHVKCERGEMIVVWQTIFSSQPSLSQVGREKREEWLGKICSKFCCVSCDCWPGRLNTGCKTVNHQHWCFRYLDFTCDKHKSNRLRSFFFFFWFVPY